jgi:TRAP-type transport system small permease protein
MALIKQGFKIDQQIKITSQIINSIGMVMLLLMMLVVVIDVAGRYLLNKPLPGSIDIVELLMVIMVFFALAYCGEGHLRVDVVYSHLPKRLQMILDCATFAASVFIVALISWQLFARAWNIFTDPPGPHTLNLDVPIWPFLCIAGVGSLIFCLELLVRLFHYINRLIR